MKKNRIIILCTLIILISGIYFVLLKTKYFKYNDETYLAVVIDGRVSTTFPSKGNYEVDVMCTGGIGKWNYDTWKLEISNTTQKTKCEIRFETVEGENFSEYLKNLVKTENVPTQSGNDNSSYFIHEVDQSETLNLGTAKALSYYNSYSTSSSVPNFTWDSTNLTWTSNNNKTASSTATITFKPSTAGNIAFCYTVSSEKNFDKASVYVDDSLMAEVSGIETGCIPLENLTTSNNIKITYSKDNSQDNGNDNVIFSMKSYTSSKESLDINYRYQGVNPNNYVAFNGELWRIIGVFDENFHGKSGQWLVKLIRKDRIGAYAWNSTGTYVWDNSSLKRLLNDNYYNSDNTNIENNCRKSFASICNYENDRGINDKYRDYIEQVTWKNGPISEAGTNYKVIKSEINSTISSTNAIGLIYVSDYGYSVYSGGKCSRKTLLSAYNSNDCVAENWLFDGGEWFLTRSTVNGYAWTTREHGGVYHVHVTDSLSIRPALYLKSNVKKIAGNGSIDNPYILTYEGE